MIELFQVLDFGVLGMFRAERKVSILGLRIRQVVVLRLGVEESAPLGVSRCDPLRRDRVVGQHREAGLA